jgi:hypothetical protein
VLAVVEHDEHLAIAQEGLQEREGAAGAVLVILSKPERGGDMGRDDVAARGGSEVDEPGAVVKAVNQALGDRNGQPCLAAARGTGDRHQSGAFQRLTRCDHVIGAADQAGEHGGQVVAGALRSGPGRRLEIRVLHQNCLLEVAQGRRGLDAQLVGQDAARVLEGTQGFGLPAAPIQRHHELFPAVLTQGLLCNRASQRVDDQIVATQRQLGVGPQLIRPAPQLFEPRHLTARPHLVGERPPGATPPQGARRLDITQGPLRLRTREVLGLPHQRLEMLGVDLGPLDRQPVAVIGRPKDHGRPAPIARFQGPPQAAHVNLQRRGRGRRWFIPPETLDQCVPLDRPRRVDQQGRQ